jgi:hypothetical protein
MMLVIAPGNAPSHSHSVSESDSGMTRCTNTGISATCSSVHREPGPCVGDLRRVGFGLSTVV